MPTPTPLTDAVRAFVESAELDDAGKARAAVAVGLAQRLDASQNGKPGLVHQTASRESRELDHIITALNKDSQQAKALQLVGSIFHKDSA
jgi:hypothetical protein